MEGCYNFVPSKFEDESTNLNGRAVNLNNCNNIAIGKSNYFGLANTGSASSPNNKCYTLKITEENNLGTKKEEMCTNRIGNKDESEGQHIYITKSLRPEENILRDCWEDLINTYPIQNPGVWLHPFINDLRIVVTTKSEEDNYEVYQNENLHPYQNKNNLNVKGKKNNVSEENKRVIEGEFKRKLKEIEIKLEKERQKLMNLDSEENINDIGVKIRLWVREKVELEKEYDNKLKALDKSLSLPKNTDSCDKETEFDQNYYREYFDVKNIPIKEKFHLAIVINEKLVEVFINGQLHTSQILFGNPQYNSGPLHISPGRKVNDQKLDLHGIITDFKYFRRALTFNQISGILKEKTFKDFDNAVVMPEEHAHKVEVVHEHPHDVVNEGDHIHNVDESNIKPEFYLEE